VVAVKQQPEQWPRGAADYEQVFIRWADWVAFWDGEALGQDPMSLPGTAMVLGSIVPGHPDSAPPDQLKAPSPKR
jgi:hypothetical protein